MGIGEMMFSLTDTFIQAIFIGIIIGHRPMLGLVGDDSYPFAVN